MNKVISNMTHSSPAPVAIGGVGGSGTRLIAQILELLGFYMGSYQNESSDNLWFTLLFKRTDLWPLEENQKDIQRSADIFLKGMTSSAVNWSNTEKDYIHQLCQKHRGPITTKNLQDFAASLLAFSGRDKSYLNWGWKEPNTHIVLPSLINFIPELKYIHVMRHGLDMAYSSNQNQLKFWGESLLNERDVEVSATNSFRYWCETHRRVLRLRNELKNNLYLLDYDQFCLHPIPQIQKLADYLKIELSEQRIEEIASSVSPPNSIGRYKQYPFPEMSEMDRQTLEEMGYHI